ncbi:hypothetical protein [Ectopseudomonas guguanensis]|uniref:hypothetical protein n=1 Tax=Ectopseudomonas guguanensis TaxID=1198456 RepID=UPI00285F8647|nr:hypothetical protein [Pseudomonas guguanensis]MDR8017920.1 hypothetical protein [Pseudomonas guguanensis]
MEVIQKKELCIVHIGMPKTGSSTIEENLFLGIDDARVRYANLGVVNHGEPIVSFYVDNPSSFYYLSGLSADDIFAKNQKNMDLLINSFVAIGNQIEIISGETFFHLPDICRKNNGLEKFKSLLDRFFSKVVVVAYVRKPSDFLPSSFQQRVKYHNTKTLNHAEFYHRYINLKKFIEVFGTENVHLWNFDPKQFPDGDILLDFTTRLGLQPQRSKIKVVNESITKEAISILFTYHFHENGKTDFGVRQNNLSFQLVELFRKIGSEKFKFSGQFIQRAIAANQEDYEWIVRVMGEDFKETPESLSAEGVDNEHELMHYATQFIPNLVELAGDFAKDLKLDDTPQTVARLVDKIMLRLAHDHR